MKEFRQLGKTRLTTFLATGIDIEGDQSMSPFTACDIPDEALRVWREDEMYRDRYDAAIDAALDAREQLKWLAEFVGIYGRRLAGNPGRHHREGYFETAEQALEAAKRRASIENIPGKKR